MSNIDMLRTCLEKNDWSLLEDFVNGILFFNEENSIVVVDREQLINKNHNPALFEELLQEHVDIFLEYTEGFLRVISSQGYPFDNRVNIKEIASAINAAGIPVTSREPFVLFPDCFEVDEKASLFFEVKR